MTDSIDLYDIDLDETVDVCRRLTGFLDQGTWRPTAVFEDVLSRTLARGRGTYEALVDLVASGRSLQGAMLGRSLFEDMVVAHWLALHRDDPQWLLQRFFDHDDAMRLHDATTRARLRPEEPVHDVSDLAGRETLLRSEYGKYAQHEWWARDRHGNRITMPELVQRLAAAPDFRPRLRGEEPILEQYFALQQKAWNQSLHHTAVGMRSVAEKGRFATVVAGVPPFMILYGNYWVFGQLAYVTLWCGAPAEASEHYYKIFLSGLALMGELMGAPVPWAGEVEKWAQDAEDHNCRS